MQTHIKGKIKTDCAKILKIIGNYFEKLSPNKKENSEEMVTLLDTYELPELNQKKMQKS